MELDIRNNPAAHQFETTVDGKTAVVQYRLKDDVMTVLHTIVPEELEGRGIAAALTKQVLNYIAAEKLQLVPLCPYMASYLKKHPEYQPLVKK
ncbi:GNAT family N-acetyltransferase [Rufibacter latericius]|uniref:N-acetyltransferase n=1 Tax=Rufibacter latericius TaxID=2487040 RepID=A0A3M9MMX9_9BACT|nr:GNAT family N-acetyltransferase [Rufibacter latericius]RNI26869.1 N-acetyltransferase [Rufibacter latericius]